MGIYLPANVTAAVIALAPYLAVAFFPGALTRWVQGLRVGLRLGLPALLCIPYLLVTSAAGDFRWQWLLVYAALPPAVAILLAQSAASDKRSGTRGNWREFLVLAVLGLAVDLRWFEGAWPAHLAIFNKVLLLDAGIYGFVLVRKLEGTGFQDSLRLRDIAIGLRELVFYSPIALALGLGLGFLHAHAVLPQPSAMVFHGCSRSFLSLFPRSCFFAVGCRICWKRGLAVGRHC